MDNAFNIVLCLILIFGLLFCKDVPELTSVNPIDPLSEDHIPSVPFNLQVTKVSDFQAGEDILKLTWKNTIEESAGISGFEIYLDIYGNEDFELVETLSFDDDIDRNIESGNIIYQSEYPFEENVLQYNFRIQSYFNGLDGVIKSDTAAVSFNNYPEHVFSINGFPFSEPPYVLIGINNSSTPFDFDIYTTDSDSTKSFFFSGRSETGSNSFTIPLDPEKDIASFSYKIKKNDFSTSFLDPRNTYFNNYFNLSLELSASTETSFTFSFVDNSDSAALKSQYPISAFDFFEVEIQEFASNDTTVIYRNDSFFPDENNVINQVDHETIYNLSVRGIRGNYFTEQKNYIIGYAPEYSDQQSFPFLFGGLTRPVIELDEINNIAFISSTSANPNILFNYKTGNYRTITVDGVHRLVVGKFLSDPVNEPGKLFIVNDYQTIRKISLDGLYPASTIDYPSLTGYNASDIEIISENDVLVLHSIETSINSGYYSLVLTRFDTETTVHSELYRVSNVEWGSFRLRYDSASNLVFLTYRDNSSQKIRVLNLDSNQVEKNIEARIYSDLYSFEVFDNVKLAVLNSPRRKSISSITNEIEIRGERNRSGEDFRSINGSTENSFTCILIRDDDVSAPIAKVECDIIKRRTMENSFYYDFQNYFSYIKAHPSTSIASKLSKDGKTLLIVFQEEILVFNFEINWRILNR